MEAVSHWSSETLDTLDRVQWLGNSLRAYLLCLLILLVGYLLIRVLHRQVLRRLRALAARTEGQFDDIAVEIASKHLLPSLYALLVYHALSDLNLKPSLARALQVAVTTLLAWQGVHIAIAFANQALRSYWNRQGETSSADREKSLKGILTIIKVVVWILAGILAMDNLGIKVSAFMAGLGITGIAVALAAQAVLGDLFAYFVIFFDKPFEIGHSIKVGDTLGEVEHIGLKTTRLRSLSGEQVVLSNKHLTDAKVQNFKKMARRRGAFTFDVEYSATDAQLRAIPGLVKNIITAQNDTTFDRCHLMAFADSGLRFETVFFVEIPDYVRYMDIQQETQLQIKAALDQLGVGFAFPTRTVHVQGGAPLEARALGG